MLYQNFDQRESQKRSFWLYMRCKQKCLKDKIISMLPPVKYSFNSKFHQIAPLRLQIEQILQYYADYSNKMCDIT